MTRNTGTRKARRNIPSFDLLVRLDGQTVSAEEISFVFTHWGRVRDVHRPYEDRDYRFVRYERKEEMKAALRGYHDGSLRYLQPEWLQCNVYESPSNSLFEVIVRDVPANISDKEWHDCVLKYGAVRAVHRIPGLQSGVCDMFVAMEDQRSHNVIKALLATVGKYHATMTDIFYGTFVPPASFCSIVGSSSKKSSTSPIASLCDRRDYFYSSPSDSVQQPPMKISPAQVALCRRASAARRTSGQRRISYPSRSPARDPSTFRSVTLLTRTNSISPDKAKFHTLTETASEADGEAALRKDPSDVWFSCGEEAAYVTTPETDTLMPPLKPDGTLLTDPKLASAVELSARVVRDCGDSSEEDDTVRLSGAATPLLSRSKTEGGGQSELGSCASTENHTHRRDESLPMDVVNIKAVDNMRKKRRSTYADVRFGCSPQSSPNALSGNAEISRVSFPVVSSKANRELWKSRNKLRRFGSDPVSLRQYAALHQSSSLLELPGLFHKLRSDKSESTTPRAYGIKLLKTAVESGSKRKSGSSLMGVPFPCDQSPLRNHYNAAKSEGRVVTLRFSETKQEGGGPLVASLPNDTALSEQEQVVEDQLILKWQRAYKIFQTGKGQTRQKSRSPIGGNGRTHLPPLGVSMSDCTNGVSSASPHSQAVKARRISNERVMERHFGDPIDGRKEMSFAGPQDARSRFVGCFAKTASDYSLDAS